MGNDTELLSQYKKRDLNPTRSQQKSYKANTREMKNQKLLRAGRPRADESLMGYIVRLTEQNCYETPSWILKIAGLEYRQLHDKCVFISKSLEGIKRLAQLFSISED